MPKNLTCMKTQFVTDDNGKKLAVILPIKEYNKMVDDLEELEDIRLYDAAKKGKQEFVDADQAFREIEKARRNEGVSFRTQGPEKTCKNTRSQLF